MHFIMEKAKGETLAEVVYLLLSKIISEGRLDTLSSACYSKIKTTCKNMLYDTDNKIGVKGIYFLCKNIALL